MPTPDDFQKLYSQFEAPIAAFDCGKKCAPYNHGVPFCCDAVHAVPTAYHAEWAHLQANTDLWRPWQAEDPEETASLEADAGPDLKLIVCKGHQFCQRGFRSLVCRAFPFFPYVDAADAFLGLSFYAEYADRCWVISNLDIVTPEYRAQFVAAYDRLFELMPGERENFKNHSFEMRGEFALRSRAIPLLHRNGQNYTINPFSGKLRRARPGAFPKYGPYRVADRLLFPDE